MKSAAWQSPPNNLKFIKCKLADKPFATVLEALRYALDDSRYPKFRTYYDDCGSVHIEWFEAKK